MKIKSIDSRIVAGSIVMIDASELLKEENSGLIGAELKRGIDLQSGENLIGQVFRTRVNSGNNTRYCDVCISIRSNSFRPENWAIDEKFLIHLCLPDGNGKSLEEFITKNNSVEISEEEVDFSETYEIYPKKDRLTHEFLNDVSLDEFKKSFNTEELIEHLIRYSLCVSSLEERFNILKQKINGTSNKPNNNRTTKENIQSIHEKLEAYTSEIWNMDDNFTAVSDTPEVQSPGLNKFYADYIATVPPRPVIDNAENDFIVNASRRKKKSSPEPTELT